MNKNLLKALPVLMAAAVAAPLLTCGTAHAIPAFARQVKTECSTCHTIYPELTEAGSNFKKNGFVWGHKAVKKPAAGDSKEYLLISAIPEYVPVSVSATLNASYDEWRGKVVNGKEPYGKSADKFDFVARAVKLQAGGNMGEKVGFWMSYNLYSAQDAPFDSNTQNVVANNVPDLVEAYGVGRHLLGTPFNLKAGRFQPGVSLWEKNDKTTIAEYSTTHGAAGNSLFSLDAPGDGAELNAALTPRIFVTLGGIKRKNVSNGDAYISARYKFGGTDFSGKDAELNLEDDAFTNYLIATVGAFGYSGTNQVGLSKQINHFYRTGAEGDITFKKLRAKLAFVYGEDNAAVINASGSNSWTESTAYSAEASYYISKSMIPTLRYERIEQPQYVGNRNRYIAAFTYGPLENIKIVGEVKVDDNGSSHTVYNLALVGAF